MNKKGLKLEQVLEKVLPRLKKLDKLNDLEYYAVFMGKIQVVEWLMKRLLTDERGYDYETIERMNLGKTIGLLREEKMRRDYLFILEDLNRYRNYFAHDFHADNFITSQILNGKTFTKPFRELSKAHFAVEQVLVVYEWITENGSFWIGRRKRPSKKRTREKALVTSPIVSDRIPPMTQKDDFERLLSKAISSPVAGRKSKKSDSYTGTRTRSRKTAGAGKKRKSTSRGQNA